MASYRIISSDTHVFEPADLWTSRIDPKFRERAPRIVHESGIDWWYVDGKRMISVQTGPRLAGGLRRLTSSLVLISMQMSGPVGIYPRST